MVLAGTIGESTAETLRQGYLKSQPVAVKSPEMPSSPKIKVVKRKNALDETTAAPMARPTEHIVRSGETLYTIASQYRLTVSDLQRLNQLTLTDTVHEGQILVLSDTAAATAVKQYQVAEGDTLFSIAYRFNISVERLCQLNQLSPTAAIAPGTVLKLQDPNE